MTTFTSTAAGAGVSPRQLHAGTQAVQFQSSAMASAAANDVVLLAKIPAGAMVLDAAVRMGHKADTQATMNLFLAKIGDGSATAIAQLATQVLSATGGATMVRPGALWTPTKISISDDAALQYAFLKLSFQAGTTTTSFSYGGYVLYSMIS